MAELSKSVNGVVLPWLRQYRPPGAIVAVRHDGQTHFFSYGSGNLARRQPVTPDSIFELASITKVFCTTSLAMEIEAGRMQLKDSVVDYIPLLKEQGHGIRQVTLEELATHTSSLPRAPNGRPAQGRWNKHNTLEWVAAWRPQYPPGSRSLYSNLAVGLLGIAIEDYEQEPLIQVWRRQFLDTLNMKHTFFVARPEDQPLVVQGYGTNGRPVPHDPPGGWPAGGRLCSSGRDMAEFLAANMGEQPQHPRITEAMQFAQRPFHKVSDKMTQGLCWQRTHQEGELVIDKNGGLDGTATYIGFMPDRHLGVVVMANRGKCQATEVGRKLLNAMLGIDRGGESADDEQASGDGS